MWLILADASAVNQLLFATALILVVSLVYGATRHETMSGILVNAYRAAIWIVSFMAVIFAILFVISWWA